MVLGNRMKDRRDAGKVAGKFWKIRSKGKQRILRTLAGYALWYGAYGFPGSAHSGRLGDPPPREYLKNSRGSPKNSSAEIHTYIHRQQIFKWHA